MVIIIAEGFVQSLLYAFRKLEEELHPREPGVLWVTDLTRCPMKYEYELRYPELATPATYDPHFILGDLVHLGLQRLLSLAKERGLTEVEFKSELEASKRLKVDEEEVIIKGRLDLLIEVKGQKVGYEVKYSRADTNIPREHHKLQASLYGWLFGLDDMRLLYITPERIVEFKVETQLADVDVLILIKEHRAKTKIPRWSWECRYCPLTILCPFKK